MNSDTAVIVYEYKKWCGKNGRFVRLEDVQKLIKDAREGFEKDQRSRGEKAVDTAWEKNRGL